MFGHFNGNLLGHVSYSLPRAHRFDTKKFMVHFTLILKSFLFFSLLARAETAETTSVAVTPTLTNLTQVCLDSLGKYKSYESLKKGETSLLEKACASAKMLSDCASVDKRPIFHIDKKGTDKSAQNVLVFSLIHGDETHAGVAARYWIERLERIEPRNNWRVVPVLNPDGVLLKTRTNGNKIDLNRNFPTKDWAELAISHWKSSTKSNPRRFPGQEGGSEPETQCALKHIEDFKPDFVVSIHTPLKVLDFDGPKVKAPRYDYLPWKALGHYPGSLGRFLWHERKIPTLTMELREDLPNNSLPFEKLQDIIGTLVLIDEKKNH